MGTRERREREKAHRREHILKTARKLFWSKGFEGTTMPEIAGAAELAPGTLYLYFRSKEALYVELLKEGYDILLARLREAVHEDAPARRQAEELMDAFIRFAGEFPDYFDIIFFVLQSEGRGLRELSSEKALMAEIEAREDACMEIARRILRALHPKARPADVSRRVEAVWSMLAGVVLYFHRDGPEVFGRVAEEAKRIILRGALGAE
jgi:AcrR family transcriptional regulator